MTTEAEKSVEVRKAPSNPALTYFDEMDRLFESFFRRPWIRPWKMEWPAISEAALPLLSGVPKVDVVERDAEIIVRAEVPGVEKKDLDISVNENALTIKGSTRRESTEEKGDYHRRELSTGTFSRTVALPASVDGSKARANFKDGILELTLPKIEQTKRYSVKVQ